MPIVFDEIVEAALQLSESDRAAVVERLLDTLSDADVGDDTLDFADPGLLHEVERRLADTSGSVPWAALRDEA